MENSLVEIWWDTQDPSNEGWAARYIPDVNNRTEGIETYGVELDEFERDEADVLEDVFRAKYPEAAIEIER